MDTYMKSFPSTDVNEMSWGAVSLICVLRTMRADG